MTRALAIALALGLALPARAADPVDLERCPAADGKVPEGGCKIPFKGALCDDACAADIAKKRKAAEDEAKRLGLEVQAAQAAQGQADVRARDAEGRPSWGTLIGVSGAALVVGIVAGVVGVVMVQDRAR